MEQARQSYASCALCTKPILDRELVYFDGGELIHAVCGRAGTGTANLIDALLRGLPGHRMCHDCLAHVLEVPYGDVRKATSALRVTPGFVIELGALCSQCEKTRVTISFRERPAAAVRPAVTEAAAMGSVRCRACGDGITRGSDLVLTGSGPSHRRCMPPGWAEG
jgi:hypothetical protein